MAEHLAPVVYFLEVHLLCASLVCLGAWLLTALEQVSATTKYWIWVAAWLNFAVPLGGLIDRFGAASIAGARQLNPLADAALGIARHGAASTALITVWLLGTALMAIRLWARIRAERRAGAPGGGQWREFQLHGVCVRITPAGRGPQVEGLIRTRICLPDGLERLLSAAEFDAVLRHELTHARRRDNLLRLGHELLLCPLWFHPLLWLAGSRLALYAELSCDDAARRAAGAGHLVAALAKLASPQSSSLLRAAVASQVGQRLERLTALEPPTASGPWNALIVAAFSALFLSGTALTIAHTACCLVVRP